MQDTTPRRPTPSSSTPSSSRSSTAPSSSRSWAPSTGASRCVPSARPCSDSLPPFPRTLTDELRRLALVARSGPSTAAPRATGATSSASCPSSRAGGRSSSRVRWRSSPSGAPSSPSGTWTRRRRPRAGSPSGTRPCVPFPLSLSPPLFPLGPLPAASTISSRRLGSPPSLFSPPRLQSPLARSTALTLSWSSRAPAVPLLADVDRRRLDPPLARRDGLLRLVDRVRQAREPAQEAPSGQAAREHQPGRVRRLFPLCDGSSGGCERGTTLLPRSRSRYPACSERALTSRPSSSSASPRRAQLLGPARRHEGREGVGRVRQVHQRREGAPEEGGGREAGQGGREEGQGGGGAEEEGRGGGASRSLSAVPVEATRRTPPSLRCASRGLVHSTDSSCPCARRPRSRPSTTRRSPPPSRRARTSSRSSSPRSPSRALDGLPSLSPSLYYSRSHQYRLRRRREMAKSLPSSRPPSVHLPPRARSLEQCP